ncbi:methyltransferase tpcM [Aspergillus stella-maris]|uniref:methyltransferase tpcM n=1 Tax=Aspergillus stella-maris TaxID=1810926 RepID=UPI003CCD6D8F
MGEQSTNTDPSQQNLGFQGSGFDWDSYIIHRPQYSENIYRRIYEYHSRLPSNAFDTAHDVGAGVGTVPENLAKQFKHVIVSEPNKEYLEITKGRLSNIAERKFTYLPERAETSSVDSESVDMIVISEAIHWTDIPSSINEFARQLKSGGTLCIIQYGRIQFPDNDEAEKVLAGLFMDVLKTTDDWDESKKEVYFRAARSVATGLDNVAFPERDWRSGVERTFTNTAGERRRLGISIGLGEEEDRFAPDDERVFVERDKEWISKGCDLEWLQGAFASFVPGRKVEEDLERWKEMERAIGGRDGRATVEWPSVQILATRI